ncbi:FAD-binding protein [Halobacteria archaeon AArc-m2/3/4]|uniref:FAD-binding protein n=1 Tax=Natronoglomus mannanivorans TaxID=2979990 RepID=A0ABT2QEL4_9EURY|nr:FAD-binding protein [Halobacteria archaeon AArc-m2/3/4]
MAAEEDDGTGGGGNRDGDGDETVPTESVEEWANWSGNLTFTPEGIAKPETEEQVQEVVQTCAEEGRTVRVVGAGHSWTPVVETDDLLVSLEKMTGMVDHDSEANTATILGGTTLEEAALEVQSVNLAMPNLGDVSMQTVAGAFGTGTHGTGTEFGNLATTLRGGRMVTGTGEIREFDADEDPEFLDAARVSLGTLGIFTELELDLVPAYKLERREYCTTFEQCRDHIEDLEQENRNFDFYWYPRSDEVKLRLLNGPGGGTDHEDLAYASLVQRETDWWNQLIPEHNEMARQFEEMEYAVPADEAEACFLEVRDRIREEWRADAGWRVLRRTVAADDTYISADYGRETVTMGIIQNASLEYTEYFEDIEEIFRRYDGRPHWGKRHTRRAGELRELYPEWDRFQKIRREMDPEGVFMSDYLTELLEGDEDRSPLEPESGESGTETKTEGEQTDDEDEEEEEQAEGANT